MSRNNERAKEQKPRRNFLKILWICLGLAALGELIIVILSFFWPAVKKKPSLSVLRTIDAGSTDTYEPGTVATFVKGQFYLACLEDGGFLAMSGKCTHLGCAVPWDKDK